MKTISERIDAAIAGLLWKEQITSEEQVESILRQHFAEPWLDKPDGPGWWWRRSNMSTSVIELRGSDFTHWDGLGCKWQRVIGPSE